MPMPGARGQTASHVAAFINGFEHERMGRGSRHSRDSRACPVRRASQPTASGQSSRRVIGAADTLRRCACFEGDASHRQVVPDDRRC